ncbi:MAG: TAXI family TRAP transporter solute-binding subunit [Aquisalimonadaceae bacterium]
MRIRAESKRSAVRVLFGAAAVALALPFASVSQAQPGSLTILSGSPGGSWYPIAAGISEILGSEGVPTNAEVGAGVANMARISRGDAELGVTTTTVPPVAEAGIEPFKAPITNVRAIAVLFPSHQQIAVTQASGVKSIAELEGRKFNCESVGNSTQAALVDVLKAAGTSESEVDCTRGSVSFGADAIKDGNIIGFTTLSAFPNGTFTELFHSVDMRMLPIPEEYYETVAKINPGYSYSEIPANTYPGQDEAVPTLRSDLMMIANESMSDDDAYWIVKTLLSRIEDIKKVHAALRPMTPEYMAAVAGIELHPGAARAFREAGIEVGD